jgi:hypothetical protein
MCNHCYHRFGRDRMATACEHLTRKMYAKGMCQNCYINGYNKSKRSDKRQSENDGALEQFP